jgi:hypothetical protein
VEIGHASEAKHRPKHYKVLVREIQKARRPVDHAESDRDQSYKQILG